MDKILVIGGGIHGVTSALAFAEKGFAVELVEKRSAILAGTSGSTHNRAHLGYHYPRCVETANECIEGLEFFKRKYPGSLHYPTENYYMIEKHDSHSSTDDFIRFCNTVDIPYTEAWPAKEVLDPTHIDSCFRVPEPNFNLPMLSKILLNECERLGVQVYLQTEIISGHRNDDETFTIDTNTGKIFNPNIVINASYAFTNNILKMLQVTDELMKYRLQHTEVVVAKTNQELPALTVMDGPFISVMPYVGYKNHVLVYDVVHSVAEEIEGYEFSEYENTKTNWEKMLEHGNKYYPFMKELKYIKSLYGSRPIPTRETKDGRKTRLTTYPSVDKLYSIQEGKFISAPVVAESLADKVISELT